MAASRALVVVAVVAVLACGVAARPHPAPTNPEAPLYVRTPGGLVWHECVHEVPSGTHLTATPWDKEVAFVGTSATQPDAKRTTIPRCTPPVGPDGNALPVFLDKPHLQSTSKRLASPVAALPSDYNGWLAYTAFNISSTFDAFLGKFSVPDTPERVAQVVYIFTGLQNFDWVPKVDPESKGAGFDIIQPVLQYPGNFGHYWSVKSWYVTIDAGAVASNEERIEVGDVVFGNMTRTGADSWFIGSSAVSKPEKQTTITVDHPRLQNQPWAYNVLEAYGVEGCSQYPKKDCLFTDLSLTTGGATVPASQVNWRVNPKPNPDLECGESITVNSASAVTISFQK